MIQKIQYRVGDKVRCVKNPTFDGDGYHRVAGTSWEEGYAFVVKKVEIVDASNLQYLTDDLKEKDKGVFSDFVEKCSELSFEIIKIKKELGI